VIEYSFYALFFLVPLVMTPWNFELFEYNKMMLVYVLIVVITASWLMKMVLQRKIIFTRTPLDIPLVIFFSSQLLSTLFSIDRHTSLWGYYSRFHGGLISTVAYLLLFYALVSNLDKKRVFNSISWLLSSAIIVSIYAVFEHFGHSFSCLMFEGNFGVGCWVQDVQNRVYATMGQPNWLAAWLIALTPLGFAFALEQESKRAREREQKLKILLFYSFTLLFYLTLLYTKSRSALAALAPTYLIFWGVVLWVSKKEFKTPLKHFLITSSLFALITLLAGSWFWQPYLKSVSQRVSISPPVFASAFAQASSDKQTSVEQPTPTPIIPEVVRGGTESQTIRNIVWKGAIDIWKHYPFFGSGVETFAYSYYNYRPVEHNLVSEWDFLYNKAHNEYLNLLATTGSVGLGSYLLLIGAFIWLSIRWLIRRHPNKNGPNRSEYLIIGLLAGYTSILITNFFGFSVVPVALQFFLYPGFAVVLTRTEQTTEDKQHREKTSELEWWQYGSIILFVLCFLFFVLRLTQFWYADVLYARGNKELKQGYQQQAFQTLQRASNLNPNEPVIHSEFGYSAALLAQLAQQQEENELKDQLINISISQSSQALSTSPTNLNFWKNRVKSFYSLAEIDPKFLDPALESLLEAIKLAPTDAKLWYNLGILYTKLEQPETAIETLEKTVEMKKNYQSARYALALLYEESGQREKAIEQVEYILIYINSSVPEVRELYKKLTGKEFGVE